MKNRETTFNERVLIDFKIKNEYDTDRDCFWSDKEVLEMMDAVNKNCNLQNVINWVATSERLPENRENVLCYNGHRMMENSWCLHTDQDASWFKERFTHWAKLPEPPYL